MKSWDAYKKDRVEVKERRRRQEQEDAERSKRDFIKTKEQYEFGRTHEDGFHSVHQSNYDAKSQGSRMTGQYRSKSLAIDECGQRL